MESIFQGAWPGEQVERKIRILGQVGEGVNAALRLQMGPTGSKHRSFPLGCESATPRVTGKPAGMNCAA